MKRFFSTPLAVVLLGAVFVLLTGLLLGQDAGWKTFVILGAAGLADILIGWGPRKTLSEVVNRGWHRDPRRYWFWLAGVAVTLWLLHLHFTGV